MNNGNILLGFLLILFSGLLALAVAMSPNPGPQTLDAIELDMGDSSLENTRSIPRPRPRPQKINPVKEQAVKSFDRPVKAPKLASVDKNMPSALAMDSVPGIDAPAFSGSIDGAAVSAADAAAGFMTRADYLELLKMRVASLKKYPAKAKSRGEQGRVRVRFKVDENGDILSVAVIDGNGSMELERAAIKAVRSASPFPRPPSGMFSYPLTLELEVCFELT